MCYFGNSARPNCSAEQSARGSPFTGLILAQTESGVMSLTDVHSGRVRLLRALGVLPQNPPPAVSPDDKFLVSPAMARLFSLASSNCL